MATRCWRKFRFTRFLSLLVSFALGVAVTLYFSPKAAQAPGNCYSFVTAESPTKQPSIVTTTIKQKQPSIVTTTIKQKQPEKPIVVKPKLFGSFRRLGSFGEPSSWLTNETEGADSKFDSVKRVHFTAAGSKVHVEYKEFMASWRNAYPDFELYLWTDNDLSDLVRQRYPNLTQFYFKSSLNKLEKSDLSRALVLHSFGGWYADMDAGCNRRADELMRTRSLVLPLEPYPHAILVFKRTRVVGNSVMYSRSGHPFWLFYLRQLMADYPKFGRKGHLWRAVDTTGPVPLSKAVASCQKLRKCGDAGDDLCPTVAQPWRFAPLIDPGAAKWMVPMYKRFCTERIAQEYLLADCRTMRARKFKNEVPADAYTFHKFLHLSGHARGAFEDVSTWNLDIRLKPLNHLK